MVASSSGPTSTLRQRPIRQGLPVVGLAEDAIRWPRPRQRLVLVQAADIDTLQVRAIGQVRAQALQPLGVDDGELAAGIGQAIFQLRPRPPGVQRRDDRAQHHAGVEGHRPLRHVAHDDGDAVALLHALRRKLMGEGRRGAEEGLETGALVLIDQEDLVAVGAAGLEHAAHRRRRVLPGADLDAVDVERLHLEGHARRGQKPVGLGDGHRRPGLGGSGRAVAASLIKRLSNRAGSWPGLNRLN